MVLALVIRIFIRVDLYRASDTRLPLPKGGLANHKANRGTRGTCLRSDSRLTIPIYRNLTRTRLRRTRRSHRNRRRTYLIRETRTILIDDIRIKLYLVTEGLIIRFSQRLRSPITYITICCIAFEGESDFAVPRRTNLDL